MTKRDSLVRISQRTQTTSYKNSDLWVEAGLSANPHVEGDSSFYEALNH